MIEKRVAALGFFDGVHIGHAALLKRVIDIGRKTGLKPAVITFDTAPQNILGPDYVLLINSLEDRVGLIRRIFNINDVISLPFDSVMATMAWDDFIDHMIIDYDVRHFVIGSNFKFGKGANGNGKFLADKCKNSSIGCDIIELVSHENEICSSTYIRELLFEGDVESANTFLGHKHVLTDIVRCGQHFGRTIGIPTINMHFQNGVLVPAHGVYATKVYIEDEADSGATELNDATALNGVTELNGVTNIGIRPTVDNSGFVTAETFIFGFEETLYDREIRLEFCKFIRPERKFNDVEELKTQIELDCKVAMEYFTYI